jgi:predicted TIM-barrel fold metal-dependent hydrolase
MRRPFFLLVFFLALHAAAARAQQSAPRVDHHQHLFSPAIAGILSDNTLSPVTPPPELEALISARARANRDLTVLQDLYAPDAVMLRSTGLPWIRGAQAIVAWWRANQNGLALRLTPISAAVNGPRGYIAAYVTAGPNEAPRHVAQLLLSIERDVNGAWRISAEAIATSGPNVIAPITAATLIRLLDTAGIQSAVVLSVAYIFGSPAFSFSDEYDRVKAENDWTSQQVAAYPQRLRAFCSFNPLKEYALTELSRCANDPNLRTGLKLHFGSSEVDLRNQDHVAKLRQVFRAANDRRMAIVVHLRPSPPRAYGAEDATMFLREIVPAAPDVPIQIAHLAGTGPGWNDPRANEALSVFADAVANKMPGTERLLFDVTTRVDLNISLEDAKDAAAQMRKIGLDRILFGSDAATGGNLPPRQAWAALRQLPLNDAEIQLIANNVAPYLRK